MNADQVKILSQQIVGETFSQVFAMGNEKADDGTLVVGWPKLSEEELSRRLDVAIRISAEKLSTLTPG